MNVIRVLFRSFENYHLFRFDIGDAAYGIRFDDDDAFMIRTRDAAHMRINKLVERGITRFTSTYDFGDDWRPRIEIEEIIPANPGIDYPRFVEDRKTVGQGKRVSVGVEIG